MSAARKWICCQIGARQHYTVPFSLHYLGYLDSVITDFWVPPNTVPARFNRNLAGRYHAGLEDTTIHALNYKAFLFEAQGYLRRLSGWRLIEERNQWFQRQALAKLKTYSARNLVLHSFSYACRELFEFAHDRGWKTVMQQIDPGPVEERIVAKLYDANPQLRGDWEPCSTRYWEQWRAECDVVDYIVVNSTWSLEALKQEGIAEKKMRVIPLAYEPSVESRSFTRTYPAEFTSTRPLQVLFLGQIDLRKGLYPLLEAIDTLHGEPIEFWFAGPLRIAVPSKFKGQPNVKWLGTVPRKDVSKLLRDADVFMFPTFSDGFGLTQLEAQSWKLPVITTNFCGDVVKNGVNGVLLNAVSGDAIAGVLMDLMRHPLKLREMSSNSRVEDQFTLQAIGRAFLNLVSGTS